MFPFEVVYKVHIKNDLEIESNSKILDFFIKDFKSSGVDNIERINNEKLLTTTTNFLKPRRGGNFNRWVGVKTSELEIIIDQNRKTIKYKINLKQSFAIGLFGFFLFWVMDTIYAGITAFIFIGILNWLIKVIQHKVCFRDVIDDITEQN